MSSNEKIEKAHKLRLERIVGNMYILDKLKNYLETNPDIRFGQALVNLNIIKVDPESDPWDQRFLDPYNDEPIEIYKRMNRKQ